MNVYDEILRDTPFAAYQFLTATSPFANLMGDSNAATTANPALSELSMVTGPGKSLKMAASTSISFPFTNRFTKASTGMSFSIGGWFGMDGPGYFLMLSHASSTDGLYFTGDAIRFAVDGDDGSRVEASWPTPDLTKNYQAIGTYDASKISLYIDGLLVAETNIPDGFVLKDQANTRLYFALPASRTARLEAPAFYYHALSPARIRAQYLAGRGELTALEAAGAYGGTVWKFSDEGRDIISSTQIDWATAGQAVDSLTSDVLTPVYDEDDLSVAGTFTFAVPIADLDAVTTIQGIKLEWNGDGTFTVQYSLNDGATWATATNGSILASTIDLSSLVTPLVKITFTAGNVPGLDVVRDMRVTSYSTNVAYAVNGRERTITLVGSPSTSTLWREPIDNDSASGTEFINSGYGIMNESTETDKTNIGTIEIWASFNNPAPGWYILDSRAVTPSNASYIWDSGSNTLSFSGFSALYINGVARTSGTFVPVPNQLYHIVGVYSTPHNAKISFSPAKLGQVNSILSITTYEAQLTASQVASLFNSYFGPPVLSVSEAATLSVTETAPAAKAYVHDWSITGAG